MFYAAECSGEICIACMYQIASGHVFASPRTVQVFCKPKILPLKSVTLQKLEEMEKRMLDLAKQQFSG